jgi:hypothetical protein
VCALATFAAAAAGRGLGGAASGASGASGARGAPEAEDEPSVDSRLADLEFTRDKFAQPLPHVADLVFARSSDKIVAEGYGTMGFLNGTLAANVAAARAGDAHAQEAMGTRFDQRLGVKQKDFKKGARWHRRAADQGHAMGQASMGHAYATGLGVTRNFAKAISFYALAAAQAHPAASFSLGAAWAERGDLDEATKWYTIVARLGLPAGVQALRRLANDGHRPAVAAMREFEPDFVPGKPAPAPPAGGGGAGGEEPLPELEL